MTKLESESRFAECESESEDFHCFRVSQGNMTTVPRILGPSRRGAMPVLASHVLARALRRRVDLRRSVAAPMLLPDTRQPGSPALQLAG